MTRFLRILTTVSLVPSTLVFLLFLVWSWNSTNWAFFSSGDGILSADGMKQSVIAEGRASEEEVVRKMALYKARIAIIVALGALGWLALYAGVLRIKSHIKEVPLAIKVGLLLGVVAAFLFPMWQHLAQVPVITVVLLFVGWFRNAPNNACKPLA